MFYWIENVVINYNLELPVTWKFSYQNHRNKLKINVYSYVQKSQLVNCIHLSRHYIRMASGDAVKVLDLDELLLEHAKDLYETRRKDLEKKWGAKDKDFEWERLPRVIRKERLLVETVSVSYRSRFAPAGLALPAAPSAKVGGSSPVAGGKAVAQTGNGSPAKAADAEEDAVPKHRSLFRTEYRNTTDIEQKYTLGTERTTTQSVHMAFSRCTYVYCTALVQFRYCIVLSVNLL